MLKRLDQIDINLTLLRNGVAVETLISRLGNSTPEMLNSLEYLDLIQKIKSIVEGVDTLCLSIDGKRIFIDLNPHTTTSLSASHLFIDSEPAYQTLVSATDDSKQAVTLPPLPKLDIK